MEECGTILTAKDMERTLERLVSEVSERRGDDERLVLLGIQRRGADLAERLKARLDAELVGSRRNEYAVSRPICRIVRRVAS